MDLSIDGGDTFLSIDLNRVDADEAIALEDAFGITWLNFLRGISDGSARAQKAVVWLAMRRDNPNLTPAEVHYDIANFAVKDDSPDPLPEDSASSESDTESSSPSSSESDPGNGDS